MIRIVVGLNSRIVREYTFDRERIGIGRAPDNDIQLDNQILSRHHAEIRRMGQDWQLRDLDSANGVFVNGERQRRHGLNDGDVIALGKFVLAVILDTARSGRPEIEDLQAHVAQGRTLDLRPRLEKNDEPPKPEGYLAIKRGPPHGVFLLRSDCFHVGGTTECELRVPGLWAPRRLAIIVRGFVGYSLLNVSRGGTGVYRNGKSIALRSWLKDGDRLEFQAVLATFREGSPERRP